MTFILGNYFPEHSYAFDKLLMTIVDVQETTLVARCELHGVAEVKGSEILLTVNALNEFDSRITGVDWRQKIENQRGAVSD